MRRKWMYLLGIILTGILITSFSLIINNFIILTRIYYKISYKTEIQNSEIVIEKSELFEYDLFFEVNYQIDRFIVEDLKLKIDDDKEKFHFYPYYKHVLIYSLKATNESLIYLTYNNSLIIKADYENQTEIFTTQRDCYLNFTLIPPPSNNSSIIVLNEVVLVRMNLKYNHVYNSLGAKIIEIEQFLCLNSNFDIIFICIPLNIFAMA
ncbi:MAG: hypothetical protein ACFFA3_01965 [Promethearchaeota archaeon]